MAIFNTVPPLAAGAGIKFDGERISTSAAPRNWLDNSDFRNPVNQRGVTTGTVTDWDYFIDRWRGINNLKYTSGAGGITISNGVFLQSLPADAKRNGQTYTFAVGLSTGKTLSMPYTLPKSAVSAWTQFNKKVFSECNLEAAGDSINYSVFIHPNASITVLWAALYEGEYPAETLPEYQPKGYGAELAECLRYLEVINTGETYGTFANGTMSSNDEAYFPIRYSEKRRIPSMNVTGKIRVFVNGSGHPVRNENIRTDHATARATRVICQPVDGGVKGQACELQASADNTAKIEFCADL